MPRSGERMWYHHDRCLHARKPVCKCPWCRGRGHGALTHAIVHAVAYEVNRWRERQVAAIKLRLRRNRTARRRAA